MILSAVHSNNLRRSYMEPTQLPELQTATYQSIPIDQIIPSRHQARKTFDTESIKQLAECLKQEGLIQPIVVRETSSVKREGTPNNTSDASRGARYELVSG